jgi:hypothetical protein
MENSQQYEGERNTSNKGDTSFSNQQPGQQLPTKDKGAVKTNPDEVPDKERHSESSKPDAKNETLGTP